MSSTFLTDLKNSASRFQSVAPQQITTGTVNGSACDMQTTDGPIAMFVDWGAITGTYSTLQVAIQESADGSTGWAALSDAPVSAAVGSQNTLETVTDWQRSKRYLRAVITATGGTNALVSVSFIARKKISGTGAGVQL